MGVAAVFTPKDFQLNAIMRDIVRLVDADGGLKAKRSLLAPICLHHYAA